MPGPHIPPRCGPGKHTLKKMEPGCEGYCPDSSRSRAPVSALGGKVGVERLNVRIDGWAFVCKTLSQTLLLPELLL